MLAWAQALGPWFWVVLGLALTGLELAVPGVFFIWLGLAALLTGLADWALDLSWQWAALAFAALALACVALGRALTRARGDAHAPGLNRRGDALIGQVFVLDAPIVAGEGRIRVADSFWRVLGPDAPAGSRIRVLSVDGTTLIVEPD